ncbi:SprB repeat-containing protein, partial [Tenacibaculum sp.]|nr:SprB repeat-containing protein [Tenacibaculum sp.]
TSKKYELIEPEKLEVNIIRTSIVSCNGDNNGELQANVKGGTSGYIYKWFKEGNSTVLGNFPKQSNLQGGVYYVEVIDVNGNTIESERYELNEPSTLDLVLEEDYILCGRGLDWTINSIVKGGTAPYTYLWNTGEDKSNLTAIKSGVYELTVVDTNGCKVTKELTLVSPEVLEIVKGNIINPTGFGLSNGLIEVSLKGGTKPYSYEWKDRGGNFLSNSTLVLNNLIDGIYTLVVTDSKGCQTSKIYELIEPEKLKVNIIQRSIVSCQGTNNGELQADVKGGVLGYTYKWYKEGNSTIIGNDSKQSNLNGGIYYVEITDSKGNEIISEKYKLNEPSRLDLVLEADYVFCGRGLDWKINSTVKGGTAPYTYLWNTRENTSYLANISSGIYELTVVDINGCKIIKEISLTSPEVLEIVTKRSVNPTGFGLSNGLVEVSLKGGTAPYNYQWEDSLGNILSNSNLILNNLLDNTYILKVTDSKGCQTSETYVLEEPEKLEVNITKTSIVSCKGANNGELQANVIGGISGYTYKWYKEGGLTVIGKSARLSNLREGIYYVLIEDSKQNKVTSLRYTLTEPTALDVILKSDYTLCGTENDWTIESIVSGGTAPYTYLWNTGKNESKLENLLVGNYSVTVVDANGCSLNRTVELALPEAITVVKKEIIDPTCYNGNDGKILIDIKGGAAPYLYNWSNGSKNKNLENVPFGDYEVVIKDSKGCELKKLYTVGNPGKIQLDLGKDVTLCNGQSYIIDGRIDNGVKYIWSSNNGFSSNEALVEVFNAGIYTLKAISNLGCEVIDEIEVKRNDVE